MAEKDEILPKWTDSESYWSVAVVILIVLGVATALVLSLDALAPARFELGSTLAAATVATLLAAWSFQARSCAANMLPSKAERFIKIAEAHAYANRAWLVCFIALIIAISALHVLATRYR